MINELDISGCQSLRKLKGSLNNLKSSEFLNKLPNASKLTHLDISDNNLSEQDLSIFSRFKNLEELLVGNSHKERIEKKKYNYIYGSLEPLASLNKLVYLDISNSDINKDVNFLPKSLRKISYSSEKRLNSKVKEIEEELDN